MALFVHVSYTLGIVGLIMSIRPRLARLSTRVRALSFRGHGGDDDDPAHALLVQLRVRQPRDRLFAAVLDEGKGAGQAQDHRCREECWC